MKEIEEGQGLEMKEQVERQDAWPSPIKDNERKREKPVFPSHRS